jgi:hypothetical protein
MIPRLLSPTHNPQIRLLQLSHADIRRAAHLSVDDQIPNHVAEGFGGSHCGFAVAQIDCFETEAGCEVGYCLSCFGGGVRIGVVGAGDEDLSARLAERGGGCVERFHGDGVEGFDYDGLGGVGLEDLDGVGKGLCLEGCR